MLPALSVARQVTAVVPAAKTEPGAGTQAAGKGPPSTTSDQVAVYDTVAPHAPCAGTVGPGEGTVIAGGFVSTTFTMNARVTVSPPSVAEQLTLVVGAKKKVVCVSAGVQVGVSVAPVDLVAVTIARRSAVAPV